MAGYAILRCLFVVYIVTIIEASRNANDIFDTRVCGTRPAYNSSRRIYGGDDASSGQWPWIGSIQQIWRQRSYHHCGCTLLNEEWAVTAAHCVIGNNPFRIDDNIRDMNVTFGITNVKSLEPSEYRITRSISGVVINPNSVTVENVRNNDIALLHLSAPIEYTDHVRPACVQTDQNQDSYQDCWVAGWGATGTTFIPEEHDEYLDELQNVQIPIAQDECNDIWSDILSDDMLCAGVDAETCHGDSGGPLVCRDQNNLWNLVGVVSWGAGICWGTAPSVFCRVPRFIEFIKISAMKYQECGTEIILESSGSHNLTSTGFPGNYDEYTYCFWTIVAPTGQRVYASFQQFSLERADFLHVGVNQDSPKSLKYTGDVLPPDLVSPNETMFISFESDIARTGKGFHIVFSSTTRDFHVCTNGIEILPPNMRCDGSPECYDLSDEQCDTVAPPDVFDTDLCGTTRDDWTSDVSSWPWIGSVQLHSAHKCACTLLNDRWVVTSPTCVHSLGDDLQKAYISFGQLSPYASEEHSVVRRVVHSIENPESKYIFSNFIRTNDLALLQLDRPVTFTNNVRPICLATSQEETKEYRNCKFASWRYTTAVYYEYDILREYSVPLISPETCRDRYNISIVSNDMICASGAEGPYNVTCYAEHGSPLVCEDLQGLYHLVGVESVCNKALGLNVFSRVSWQLPFLTIGVNTGRIPCRNDQYMCNDGQCLSSHWTKCNVTSECKDGSDEHGCDYCPEKEMTLSLNSTIRLQSVGYPYGYHASQCKWMVTPAPGRKVMVRIIDIELANYTYLYVGGKTDPRLIRYSGDDIPKLRLLAAVDDSLHFEFQSTYSNSSSKGFAMLLSDSNEQHPQYCLNGLEVYNEVEDVHHCKITTGIYYPVYSSDSSTSKPVDANPTNPSDSSTSKPVDVNPTNPSDSSTSKPPDINPTNSGDVTTYNPDDNNSTMGGGNNKHPDGGDKNSNDRAISKIGKIKLTFGIVGGAVFIIVVVLVIRSRCRGSTIPRRRLHNVVI